MRSEDAKAVVKLMTDLWPSSTEWNAATVNTIVDELRHKHGTAEQAETALRSAWREGLRFASVDGRKRIMQRLWDSQRQPDTRVIEAIRADTSEKPASSQHPDEHVADWLLRWPDAVAAEGGVFPIDCTPEQWRAMDDTSRASTWLHSIGVKHAHGAGRERFVRLAVKTFKAIGVDPEDIAGWLEQHFHGGSAKTKPAGDVNIWEAVA